MADFYSHDLPARRQRTPLDSQLAADILDEGQAARWARERLLEYLDSRLEKAMQRERRGAHERG